MDSFKTNATMTSYTEGTLKTPLRIYLDYLKYVLEHKKNVFKVAWKEKMYIHALTHDLSKFSPKEFKAYAEWFYGDYGVKWKNEKGLFDLDDEFGKEYNSILKDEFNKAWQHHKDKNKHHWNYWSERNIPMPYKYIRQMIVDWTAMSIKFGDTPQKFYLNKYTEIEMDYYGRTLLEFDIGLNDSIINNCGKPLIEFYKDDKDCFSRKKNFGWIEHKYNIKFDEIFKM